ncbi:hypothetical protein CE91St64_35270 [Faecalicatena contorta]|nr:hypothetical protein CE91St64_35270 [Faecalicatena contorta]
MRNSRLRRPHRGIYLYAAVRIPRRAFYLIDELFYKIKWSFACETRACGGRIAASTFYAAVRIPRRAFYLIDELFYKIKWSFACETRACGGRIAASTFYAAVRIPPGGLIV